MGWLFLLLALAAPPPARPLRAIVMRESLAAPFVHSNELGDRQASPLWELSGGKIRLKDSNKRSFNPAVTPTPSVGIPGPP